MSDKESFTREASGATYMPKAIQIAVNNTELIVLADDGQIGRFNLSSGAWSLVPLPPGINPKPRIIECQVVHRNLPNGYELWRDGETGLWQWKREDGSEVSAIFATAEDAVSDAKTKQMLSTLPTAA
jgi:hypothetical protein